MSLNVQVLYEALGFVPNLQNGVWDQGDCILPFGVHDHGGRNKLGFNREKEYFHCWQCGSVSLVNFVKEVKDFTTKEQAQEWLARFYSDEWDDVIYKLEHLWEEPKAQEDSVPYFSVARLEEWNSYHPWFEERGISEAVRIKFDLRYAHNALIGGYEGPAVVLPHFWRRQLVGWQYRWLYAPNDVPKYSFTKRFPRRSTLWGFDSAGSPPIIVVESVPTALRLISLGYSAIATFGSEVSSEQIKLMRSLQDGLIIAPDNDKPGRKFAKTLTNGLENFIPIWYVNPPDTEGSDLGDFKDDSEIITTLENKYV